jgi:hypothetical protein
MVSPAALNVWKDMAGFWLTGLLMLPQILVSYHYPKWYWFNAAAKFWSEQAYGDGPDFWF